MASIKARQRRQEKQRIIEIDKQTDGTTIVRIYDGRMLMRPVHAPFTDESDAAEYIGQFSLRCMELGFKVDVRELKKVNTDQ